MDRQEMIDELLEGAAFEDDSMIERLIRKYENMTDAELKALLEE